LWCWRFENRRYVLTISHLVGCSFATLFVFMCILFLCHYNCVYVIFAGKCNKEKINFLCYALNKVMIFSSFITATEYLNVLFLKFLVEYVSRMISIDFQRMFFFCSRIQMRLMATIFCTIICGVAGVYIYFRVIESIIL